MFSNNSLCHAQYQEFITVRVTIFSTGGKFQPVSNFTELHALTLAACSYALLLGMIVCTGGRVVETYGHRV